MLMADITIEGTVSMSKSHRALATFQIDLDGLRILMAQFGYTLDDEDTVIFSQAVPEFLALLERHDIHATFYCVGEDALADTNRQWMVALTQAGHELGNHSLSHDWRYAEGSPEEKRHQLEEAHHLLEKATGVEVKGFRGPGFCVDVEHLTLLKKFDYTYDSSVLPSPYAPVMMRIGLQFMSGGERPKAKYGDVHLGLAPLHPYFPDPERPWALGSQRALCEIPVSVLPGLRLPFHGTVLFVMGLWYFYMCASLVSRMGLPLVFVMHGIDLLSETVEPRLSSFTTCRRPLEERREMLDRVLSWTKERFEIVTTLELARRFKRTGHWGSVTLGEIEE